MTEDRRDYTDLKDYIRETLGVEIGRLSAAFGDMSRTLKEIDLRTTTRTAELQKDITELYKDVDALKKALDQEEATRQFLSNENRAMISNLRNEQVAKWETQIKINEGIGKLDEKFKDLRSIMWLIFSVVVGILGTAIWQMIVGGGAGALVK